MSSYYLVAPEEGSPVLDHLIRGFVAGAGEPAGVIKTAGPLPRLDHQKLLFAAQLDQIGQSRGMNAILSALYDRGPNALEGTKGMVLVASPDELSTKSYAQNLIFLTNRLGCAYPGHPLVEAVAGYGNFSTWQKTYALPLADIAREIAKGQGARFMKDLPPSLEKPRILALHASSRKTSNTVMLWDMIRQHLPGWETAELNVDKGIVLDCRGCDYQECIHFSTQNSCFYGGVVVKEILPSVERADVIVWICPNYNDAISANLMAVINRMTVLYRKIRFYQKSFFAVIVSGNSGSDAVAKQLIGALNINKGFWLPARFAVMATANDPGDIKTVSGIEEKAQLFAENMVREIKAELRIPEGLTEEGFGRKIHENKNPCGG